MAEEISKTCEEASILSKETFIACGNPAVRRVLSERGKKTYSMCAACASHNLKNRGCEDAGTVKAALDKFEAEKTMVDTGGDAFPTNYDQDGGVRYPGMSLRAYYVGQLGSRLMVRHNGSTPGPDWRKSAAEEAVLQANALIEAQK